MHAGSRLGRAMKPRQQREQRLLRLGDHHAARLPGRLRELGRHEHHAGTRRAERGGVLGGAEEAQIRGRCAVERRDAADGRGRIADQAAADRLRNSRGGEDDSALTAAYRTRPRRRVVCHCVGGLGFVTPAGAAGAPPLVAAGITGAFVARKREIALSVMSRFLSADTIGGLPRIVHEDHRVVAFFAQIVEHLLHHVDDRRQHFLLALVVLLLERRVLGLEVLLERLDRLRLLVLLGGRHRRLVLLELRQPRVDGIPQLRKLRLERVAFTRENGCRGIAPGGRFHEGRGVDVSDLHRPLSPAAAPTPMVGMSAIKVARTIECIENSLLEDLTELEMHLPTGAG